MHDLYLLHVCTFLLLHVALYLTQSSGITYVFLTQNIKKKTLITLFVMSGKLCNYVTNFTLVILNSVTFCAAFSNASSLVEAVYFCAVSSFHTSRRNLIKFVDS
jgi:hypothetical protein